jgi:hypothetical protein
LPIGPEQDATWERGGLPGGKPPQIPGKSPIRKPGFRSLAFVPQIRTLLIPSVRPENQAAFYSALKNQENAHDEEPPA